MHCPNDHWITTFKFLHYYVLTCYVEYIQICIQRQITAFLHIPPFHCTKLYNITACDHNILQQHITIQTRIHMYIYVQLFGGGKAAEVGHISSGRKCKCVITVIVNITYYIVHPALLTPNSTDTQHY